MAAQQITNTNLQQFSVSTTTADKPQSKVWTYNGDWYCVMANTSGTKVWKLNGTSWSSVVTLTTSNDLHADVKVVGNLVHILLFDDLDDNVYIQTLEFNNSTQTYQPWSVKPAATLIDLGSGGGRKTETATMDIDSQGKMWLCYERSGVVYVRWSNAPYSSWSSTIQIVSGIHQRDIAGIVAFTDNQGSKIGVAWSDHNTERFGFRYHLDTNSPTTWSSNEIPGNANALNVGIGMADDHINLATTTDGNLYMAAKTSYDQKGYATLILLNRKPNQTWGYHEVEFDDQGTKPVVVANEAANKLIIAYAYPSNNAGDMVYKIASLDSLDNFAAANRNIIIDRDGSVVDMASSMKDTWSDELVIMGYHPTTGTVRSTLLQIANNSDNTPPSVVLNLAYTGRTTSSVSLQWSPSTDNTAVTGYKIYLDGSLRDSTTGTTFTVSGLNPATPYDFQVTALDAAGNQSALSSILTVSTLNLPNVAPVAALSSDITSGIVPVTVNFDASTSTDSDGVITSYIWNFGDGNSASGVTASHTYTTSGNYHVVLTVTDDSSATDTASINISATPKVAQTITFGPLANKQTADAAFVVSATASSGLPVSFSVVSGPATMSGNSVTLTGVTGTVVIRASQAGNGTYASATDVDQSFDVLDNTSPAVVVNLTSTGRTISSVSLQWNPSTDNTAVTGYKIYLDGSLRDSTTGTTFTVSGLNPATPYDFQVTALDAAGNQSALSSILTVSTLNLPNVAPVAALSSDITSGIVPVTVNFDASTSTDSDGVITSYIWNFGDGNSASGVTASHTYTTSGNYHVVLTVTDDSSATDTASIAISVLEKTAQSITFDPLAAKISNDDPFTVAASASSGLPVSFSVVSGPATISGDTVSLTGVAGTVVIRASQAGDATFAPAADVDQSFVVTEYVPPVFNVAPVAALSSDITSGIVPVTVNFDASTSTDSDGLIAAYSWDFGDGNSATGITASHTYTTSGNYLVVLTVTDDSSATDTASIAISVLEKTAQSITFDPLAAKISNDDPFTVAASASSGLPVSFSVVSGPATISGDTVSLTGVAGTVVIRASQAGDATFAPAADVDQSFVVTEYVPPVFNVAPVAALSSDITSGIVPVTVNFDASTSTDSDGLIAAYSWDFGDGNSATGVTASHTYTTSGNYLVVLTVTDDSSATDTASIAISVLEKTAQSITFDPLAAKISNDDPFTVAAFASSGLPVSFSVVSGPATMSGDTVSLTGVAGTVVIRASQAGDATFAPAADVNQSFVVTEYVPPVFNVAPVAALSSDITSGIVPVTVNFDASASTDSDGVIAAYSWDFGDGNSATGITASHTYTTSGNYLVVLTVTDDSSATDTASIAISVLEKTAQSITFDPLAAKISNDDPFTVAASASSGLPVSFSVVSGPATISGDTVSLTGVAGTVVIRASQAGDATFAPAADVDQSFVVTEYVPPVFNVAPVAALSSDITSGIVPVTVNFDASTSTDSDGVIAAYSWDFGDGNSATGVTASHTYTTSGNYLVVLTVTDDSSATDTASITISVLEKTAQSITFDPLAAKISNDDPFTVAASASSGLPVSFSVVSGPATISGDTVSLTGVAGTVVIRASQAGDATFAPAADVDQSFVVTEYVPPVFNVAPVAALSSDITSGIVPVTVNFDASPSTDSDGVITSYIWNFGDGNSASGVTASHTYTTSGNYHVVLTVTDDSSATDTASIVISVLEKTAQSITFDPLAAKISNDDPFTVAASASSGLPVSFSVVSGPATISGDTVSLTGVAGTVVIRASQAGDATFAPAADVDQSFVVTEYVPPVPNVAPTAALASDIAGGIAPITVNFDGSASFDTDGVVVSYSWDFGDGNVATGSTASHSYTNAGNYLVVLTVTDDSSATDTDSITIVTTNKQTQTITFAPLADKQTTDGAFTVNAAATSGLAVSFSVVSGPATIIGNTVTLTGTAGTVTLRASQGGDATYFPAADVDQSFDVLAPSGPTVVMVQISNSSDDAEQRYSTTKVDIISPDLELGFEGPNAQLNGIRFSGLNIPQGSTILNAYVQFTVDEVKKGAISLNIKGEASDDSSPFQSTNLNVSNRPTTSANVPWAPVNWTVIGEQGVDQRTPDISTIVQEIVNRPGWTTSSALSILIDGTGTRTAVSYDGAVTNEAPILYVEYQPSNGASARKAALQETLSPTQELVLYPNPFQDEFFIKAEIDGVEYISISIINSLGQIVHEENNLSVRKPVRVQPHLTEGIYSVIIKTSNGQVRSILSVKN
ncbi:MAG: PKD domain-containing protein [Bacteroidia bacterium]